MPIIESYRYTRPDIQSHRDWLFVFGDNLQGRGYGGQAKEARGEPNAVGIVTKRLPSMAEGAFLQDSDVLRVTPLWQQAFSKINLHLMGGGVVIWPSEGVGTGRAQLPARAPGLWQELNLFIAAMKSVAEANGQIGFGKALGEPSITCPRCGLTSYNGNDIRERYCGNCHMWHDQMEGGQ